MEILIIVWLGILGAVFGSFLGCMGYRIPNKIKTTYPSSFCSNCKKPLKWYMNIPIISYIALNGKCHYCHKKIGFIYFLSELLGCALFIISYEVFGFNMNFFISIILVCVFLVTMVSDFEYYYISDRVLVISGIALLITLFYYLDTPDALERIVSAIILFLVMFGIKILGNSMFKRESLGDGDIKLMAVIGLSLGIFNSFVSLFFAAVIALIFSLITLKKHPDGLIPFGPFIIMGALIVVYFSNILTPYLENLFSL